MLLVSIGNFATHLFEFFKYKTYKFFSYNLQVDFKNLFVSLFWCRFP